VWRVDYPARDTGGGESSDADAVRYPDRAVRLGVVLGVDRLDCGNGIVTATFPIVPRRVTTSVFSATSPTVSPVRTRSPSWKARV
jgi:hypothetical protein